MSLQSEYLKEYNRIKNLYNSISKRGYKIGLEMPTKVKKPTKASINKLKKITPDYIYRRSTYTLSNGETVPGIVRRAQERRAAGKKGAIKRSLKRSFATVNESLTLPEESSLILDKIMQAIETWTPAINWSENLTGLKRQDVNTLKHILNGAITEYGKDRVLANIKKNSKEISGIIERALYGGYSNSRSTFASGRQQADHDLVTLGELLKGEPLNSEEVMSLTDLMEESVFYS